MFSIISIFLILYAISNTSCTQIHSQSQDNDEFKAEEEQFASQQESGKQNNEALVPSSQAFNKPPPLVLFNEKGQPQQTYHF